MNKNLPQYPGEYPPVPDKLSPEQDLKKIVLDRLKFKLDFRLNVEETNIYLIHKQIDAICSLEMMGQRVEKTQTVDFYHYQPANWWQHLKHDLYNSTRLPDKLLAYCADRWPVKYTETKYSREITFNESLIFPDIDFLKQNRHIVMEQMDAGADNITRRTLYINAIKPPQRPHIGSIVKVKDGLLNDECRGRRYVVTSVACDTVYCVYTDEKVLPYPEVFLVEHLDIIKL